MNDVFLLFDLDGTISNPLEGISRSFNYALAFYGYQELPIVDIQQYIGPPLDECFVMITGLDNKNDIASLVTKYREHYSAVGFTENKLYPGVRDALNVFASRGIPMGICTSKKKIIAEKILKFFAIHHHFDFVSGGDNGVKKWQQIQVLLDTASISLSSIMVGDRAVDLSAAHKNGLKSAGVLWGYGSRSELESQSPRRLLSNPVELLTLVDEA